MVERISLQDIIRDRRFRSIIDPDELLSSWPTDRLVARVELPMSRDYFASWHRTLIKKRNRRGEVVLILQKPDGSVLLHTKSFYPGGCFRLPTGGLDPKEKLADGLKRELYEETGFKNSDGRLLDIVFYDFSCDDDHLSFVSYLIHWTNVLQEPRVQDIEEDISGFCWVAAHELERIGNELAGLQPPWHEWGRMRALAHWVAAKSLNAG